MRRIRTILCFFSAMAIALGSPGAGSFAATEAQPDSPTWGGEPVRRTYSSPRAQEAFERQIEERRGAPEGEIYTEPLPEGAEGEADEPEPVPTRAVRLSPDQVKRYIYKPREADALAPLPLDQPGEMELDTEPLPGEGERWSGRGAVLLSFKTKLDRLRVHLDESFTLTVEIAVSDLDSLSRLTLPRLPDFNLINAYQSDTSISAEQAIWRVRTQRYVFLAQRPGRYVIPPLTFTYADKTYWTRKLTLEAEGSRSGVSYHSPISGVRYQAGAIVPSAPDTRGRDMADVEFTAQLSAREAFVDQQVILTVHLSYTIDDQTTVAYRPPVLAGFLSEELPDSKTEEMFSGGKMRFVEHLYRTALFPVRPGNLVIGVAEVVFKTKSKKKPQLTDPLSLTVRPLPEDAAAGKHAGGLVGTYQLAARANTREAVAGNPLSLTVSLAGEGNVRSAPDPILPETPYVHFYLENRDEDIFYRETGITGKRNYHYLVVSDKPGRIPLGLARLRYFRPAENQWRSAEAKLPVINIKPRPVAPVQVAPALDTALSLSLRPNRGGSSVLSRPTRWVATTPGFWLLQLLGPLAIGLIFAGRRWLAHTRADTEAARVRRAYAQARKSLRQIKRHIRRREEQKFYDGLARTTAAYLAAKFKQPSVFIGIERLPELFEQYEVPNDLRSRFKIAMTACEYVRYAAAVLPSKDMLSLHRDLKGAIRAFEKFWAERIRQRTKLSGTSGALLLLLCLATTSLAGDAELQFLRGNALADNGQHAEAEVEYRQLIALGIEDADVYFNLGNTYLQQGKLGPAILAYERGLQLSPRDSDLRHNLREAQAAVRAPSPREVRAQRESILVRMYRAITPSEAAWLASGGYLLAVMLVSLVLLWPDRFQRLKIAVLVLAGLTLGLIVWSGARQFEPKWWKRAVVLAGESEVRGRPYANAEVVRTLPEGTPVTVKQEESEWVEIHFKPHRRGWTRRSALGFIE